MKPPFAITPALAPLLAVGVATTFICAGYCAVSSIPDKLKPFAQTVAKEATSRPTADSSSFAATDPNFAENKDIREQKVANRSGRTIYAWNKMYGVVNKEWTLGYYYTPEGKLFGFDFYIGKGFPKKAFGYTYPQGQLVMRGIAIKPDTFYEISEAGELTGSVEGNQVYGANGEPKEGPDNQRVIFYSR